MKIERKEKVFPVKNTWIPQIPIDTIFSGNYNGYEGIFLKFYEGIVLLDNPSKVWDCKDCEPNTIGNEVRNYRRAKAHLVIDEYE